MWTVLLKVAVLTIVLVLLLQPVVESFDTWDGAGPSNDTEFTVVGLVIGVALVLTIRSALAALAEFTGTSSASAIMTGSPESFFTETLHSSRLESLQPLIPLRI